MADFLNSPDLVIPKAPGGLFSQRTIYAPPATAKPETPCAPTGADLQQMANNQQMINDQQMLNDQMFQ